MNPPLFLPFFLPMPGAKQSPFHITQLRLFKWFLLLLIISLPVLATLSYYGLTFDEPIYMEATWNIRKWLSLGPDRIFDPVEISYYWKTDPDRNVHPAALKWLYLTAQNIIFWENDPYRQNRVLSIFLFSISLLVFLHWWGDGAFKRDALFVLLLLSIPRFFAHIHFAATDIPMASFLLLFLVCLDRTLLQRYFWLSGIIFGLFVSIKFTSLLLAFPVLLAFVLRYRDEWKTVIPRIAIVCLVGLLVFYALNPDWWFSPLSRSREFLRQSLTRRSWTPFTVYFGGRLYSYRGPFYYPFIMFFITTPLLHNLLLLSGLAFFLSKRDLRANPKMNIIFACLLFPFLLLALPTSPAHDGIRYLLPAFPFAVCFMSLGLQELWRFASERTSKPSLRLASRWTVAGVIFALLALEFPNPAWGPPFELSYYNKIVGELPGAYRRGYEVTYWWETLNDDVLRRLNDLCAGSSVYFPLPPTDLFFEHMRKQGKIDFFPAQDHPERADFMLIFGRPSIRFWESRTWPLYRQQGKTPLPVWTISLDSIPLLKLYRIKKRLGDQNSKTVWAGQTGRRCQSLS